MIGNARSLHALSATLASGILAIASVACAQGKVSLTVLYSFQNGNDGANPQGKVVADTHGNLYGTTTVGGKASVGTIFKLAPDGTETVLHSFGQAADGSVPRAGLIFDAEGNLYGTTSAGGTNKYGTVFELKPDGTETLLYSFSGTDGKYPWSSLIADTAGNFYGTTRNGGTTDNGTVFELATDGTETVLHSFDTKHDGSEPEAGLLADDSGNLYGTAPIGGPHNGRGTVFKLATDDKETVLYTFASCGNGCGPETKLVSDDAGNLYGTTPFGLGRQFIGGTVFELAKDGQESVLYAFKGKKDGASPNELLIDKSTGNLYGSAFGGGNTSCYYGCGTVFEVTASGVESTLYSFRGSDGANPESRLLADKAGNLYGTTYAGGTGSCNSPHYSGCGTIFELKK